MNKIIIGIDPGYDRLGISIIEKISNSENKLLFSTCIISDRKKDLNQRIFDLCEEIKKTILKYKNKNKNNKIEFSIEKLFFTKNQKTAMGVSEMRGAIIYLIQTLNIKIFEYTPLEIKIALTGYGKAEKSQVIFMIKKILKLENKDNKRFDDEYDAIACALTHSATIK